MNKELNTEFLSMIFCPKTKSCAVKRTWFLMSDYNENNYLKLNIDKWYSNFINAFKSVYTHQVIPNTKFVFAHGVPSKDGFESMTKEILSNIWWKNENAYNLGIFHACKGSIVLSDTKWNSIFKDWVSYNDDLPIIFGLKTDENWKEIFKSMSLILNNFSSGKEIKSEFEKIYKTNLLILETLPKGSGAELMKSHITIAINSLKCKSENIN